MCVWMYRQTGEPEITTSFLQDPWLLRPGVLPIVSMYDVYGRGTGRINENTAGSAFLWYTDRTKNMLPRMCIQEVAVHTVDGEAT